MKKKELMTYLIAMIFIVMLGFVVYEKSENSYSFTGDINSINLVNEKIIDGYKSVEYDVVINNKNHKVRLTPQVNDNEKLFTLSFDGNEVKENITSEEFDYFKNKDDYSLSTKDFYFIKGADSKTYLGIRFVNMLMIFNEDGKVLTHKPFDEELNYFNYEFEDNNNYFRGKVMSFDDENQNDIKSKYFYKDSRFTINDGYVTTKVENNKIYSFVVAPNLDYVIYDYYPNYVYLYENEYVINNDEIYFKQVSKYKVYIHDWE